MPARGVQELAQARENVECVCRMLVIQSADALEAAHSLLGAAAEQVRATTVSRGNPAVRAEAVRLRAAVVRAAALLNYAAAYHAGWNRWLTARTMGYQAGGLPAGMARLSLVSVNG